MHATFAGLIGSESAASELVDGNLWLAVSDLVKIKHPEILSGSWEDFVNLFWPKVQAFFAPLHRDTFYPFVAVSCAMR